MSCGSGPPSRVDSANQQKAAAAQVSGQPALVSAAVSFAQHRVEVEGSPKLTNETKTYKAIVAGSLVR